MTENPNIELLSQTLNEIYIHNINYLEKNHPKISEKIIAFEKKSLTTLNLDFIDSHLDIFDDTKNKYIYNCDPYYDSTYRVSNISKNGHFNILNLKKRKNEYSKDSYDFSLYINEYLKYISEIQVNLDKFIFIGSLLGIHILDLLREKDIDTCLIFEPNIEIFRLSLFTTDYQEMCSKTNVFFCINEDEKTTKSIINNFLSFNSQFNSYITFELSHEDYINYVELIGKYLTQENLEGYPYSEYIRSYTRALNYFNSEYKLINISKTYDFINKPLIFLGAGPSLSKNIDFIKKNQQKLVIVCIASALKRLEKHNIIPDIILSHDSKDIILKQFDVNPKYYRKSILIATVKTNNNILKLFDKNNIYLVQDAIEVFDGLGTSTGVTVGDTGFELLLKLGVKEIYLLGFDAAFDADGSTHDKLHYDIKKDLNEFNILENSNIDSNEYVLKVKGNFRKIVYTNLILSNMIDSFNEISNNFKDVAKYNLSDGAYFYGIIPFQTRNIKLNINIDKNELINNLKQSLNNISKTKLNEEEHNNLKKEKDFLSIKESDDKNYITVQILNNFKTLIQPYYYQLFLKNPNLANKIRETQIKIIKKTILNSLNSY